MSYQLRMPFQPEPGESLAGLIARNAATYRFRQPKQLLHRINPPGHVLWSLCDTDPAQPFGASLRTLLGIGKVAVFNRLSPWTGDPTTWSILGSPVWRELVHPEGRAACPLCLQEKVYHRAIWYVRAMPVCAVHGIWLHTKCHVCRKPFSWHNSQHQLCSSAPICRADVRQAPVVNAPAHTLAAVEGLHDLAHSKVGGLLELGFGEALKLSFLLGQIALGFERNARPPGFMTRHAEQVPDVISLGWNTLQDWPNGFNRMLDGLRARADKRTGKGGLKKAFGTLSAHVYRWAREPWGAPIGEAFAKYAASLSDLSTTAHTLRRYAPGVEIRREFLTTAEAQHALGLSASTIIRMAHRRGLYVLPPQGPGLPSLIRADAFREIAEEVNDFLLPEQARRELGVGRKVMDQLEAEGLIRRLPKDEMVMETKPFRLSEIRTFVQACSTSETKLTKAEGRKLSTLISATAPGRSVPDICRALMDGRLRLAGSVPDAKGLLQGRLLLAEVERVLPSSKETLSLLDAAKQIGLHYEDVVHWAGRGLLETVRSSGAEERGLRLTRETWENFLKEYATSKMLARELGQKSNTWVSRHLRFLGIEPVSGEGVDGGSAMLFRRADVGPKALKEIRRLQQGPTGSPQDLHRQSFARAKAVAAMIEDDWSAVFTRSHNMFTDNTTGTALQVITGRRPDLTGVFLFHLWTGTLESLRKHSNPWVALVPNEGDHFLLMPADQVPFRGGDMTHLETR